MSSGLCQPQSIVSDDELAVMDARGRVGARSCARHLSVALMIASLTSFNAFRKSVSRPSLSLANELLQLIPCFIQSGEHGRCCGDQAGIGFAGIVIRARESNRAVGKINFEAETQLTAASVRP
jgi:hypothetical protein